MGIQVVWFKRDLRVEDHEPLVEAARQGPLVCLLVLEPSFWAQPEMDRSHLEFVAQGARSLDRALRARGSRLLVRVGEMPRVLEELERELAPAGGIAALWSHQECGGRVSYERDLRVERWCRERGLPWHERCQDGVQRRLATRDGWARLWQQRMDAPLVEPPPAIPDARLLLPRLRRGSWPSAQELARESTTVVEVQPGGAEHARELLASFLARRGVNYRADLSSPITGWEGCSRLSPYLAWGQLSLRTVHQATRARANELRALGREERDPRWLRSLRSFEGRLRWHCHFLQKLEDEPAIEFRNMHRAYDGLREDAFDEARFEAWRDGRTGYPMVDAVMRCLARTGWVNFRMRAMVMSFASYHLWLHWRPTGLLLARRFLDFEPGIHWSQAQMQSGTTGMNTLRIYSPAKQVRDQDPQGVFVRRWVPELAGVPAAFLAEPHTMPPEVQRAAGCRIGRDYPPPVVEHTSAVRLAKERLWAVRRTAEARAEARQVVERHGSRRKAVR